MALLVNEQMVNVTEGYRYGPDPGDMYEPFTDEIGRLFRAYQKEYGRCVSRVYVDVDGGEPIAVGWVFSKRVAYEDTGDLYEQEVWVTLYTSPDTVTREHHYHEIGRAS